MRKARKLGDVQAERAAKAEAQQAKARARETRERVKREIRGDDGPPVSREYTSTITGQRPRCYTDPTGRDRLNAHRFLSDCCDETRELLTKAWKRGDQLMARRVPVDGLAPVVIMAGYLRAYGAELVDDFDALLERFTDHIKETAHPDKFFASCINILHRRFQSPDEEAFDSINIPAIYEELF